MTLKIARASRGELYWYRRDWTHSITTHRWRRHAGIPAHTTVGHRSYHSAPPLMSATFGQLPLCFYGNTLRTGPAVQIAPLSRFNCTHRTLAIGRLALRFYRLLSYRKYDAIMLTESAQLTLCFHNIGLRNGSAVRTHRSPSILQLALLSVALNNIDTRNVRRLSC